MSLQSVPLLSYDFFPSRPVQVEVSTAPLSSDAGLLPVRQFDERIRLTEQFAAAIEDERDPTFTKQTVLTMAAADLRYPGRLRGPERPRHPGIRPHLQAHCRSSAGRSRPSQSTHAIAV